MPLEPQYKLS